MLTVKKQLTALGLLLLVALPLFFSAFTYVKQQYLQHQRTQRFKTEFLETITVEAQKVNWIEAGKEIQVDGNLFDVESFKTMGTDMVFRGFYDHKEGKLVKHLHEIEKQKSKEGNPLNHLAVKFLFLPNYKEITAFSIQNNWHYILTTFPEYAESISNMAYPAIAPPPKNC